MSEEEYSEEEYEEEEEEVEEAEQEAEPAHHDDYSSQRRTQRISETVDTENLSEAEKAMLAAKKRQQDEDAAKILDYEERRRIEREREEEELKLLKEKQEQRRLQREAEERQQAERRQQDEERRLQEEEARKARMEADRKKKEEEKMKRAQMLGGLTGGTGGRNFVVPEKKDKADKFGNIVQAKQEMGMTKEQQEQQKQAFLATIRKQIDIDSVLSGDLKAKIKEMHHRICKLEAEKYDLEKRHERQTYDLRELNERSRQAARKTNKKGVDVTDNTNGRHPPKIAVVNKYDRQIDRRNFGERRAVFDKRNAFPCFPNVPPPPTILEFKPKKEVRYDVYQNEEPEEEEEEEYEEEDEEEEE